ncbi:MAG TPA: class II aldolase/adducin family protein [Vicinamibacterales bacterium]|jgi:HCOMODA/2-hydroxy-3-carboxy-muconic semialdehyde decarboxylase|nr:class II aldolase/adducin family protein [Vicinamibacterales bacterium]
MDRRAFSIVLSAFALRPITALAQADVPRELIDDLVAGNRILAQQGVLDGQGHISVRHPQRRDHFLLARSVAPALVTADDILEYDLNADPIDAGGRTSYRERFIHSEVYRARPDVRSVVHCHTTSLLPFADSDVPMRAMYHMAAFVALGVPVFDIRKEAGMTDLLVGDTRLGRALARTLADKFAVLMRHHGAVVVANSIPNAVARAVYLDQNARIQLQTMQLGAGRWTYVDPAEAKLRMADPNEYSRAWDLWKRELPGLK